MNWTKGDNVVSEVPTFSFTVTESALYVAHFEKNKYNITVSADPEEGGEVTGGGIYYHGVTCTLAATPKPNYHFLNWTDSDGTIASLDPLFTFIVTADASYTAHFTQEQLYTITVLADPEEGGTVSGGGTYPLGAICTLTATPNLGYTFVNWKNSDNIIVSNESTFMFQVMSDATYTATFSGHPIYIISATAGPYGSITPEGDVYVDQGEPQDFIITPDPGCSIAKILIDGNDIGVFGAFTLKYTFYSVNCNHTISVSFNGMGVEDAQVLNVSIYPNPAKDKVYVEGDGIETLVLFDMFGNCLRSIDYDTSNELNVSGLPKGVYVLQLTTQDGRIGYQKLMLR